MMNKKLVKIISKVSVNNGFMKLTYGKEYDVISLNKNGFNIFDDNGTKQNFSNNGHFCEINLIKIYTYEVDQKFMNKYNFLMWFYGECDFGVHHSDVLSSMHKRYELMHEKTINMNSKDEVSDADRQIEICF